MSTLLDVPASFPVASVAGNGEPLRILVVDDNADMRRLEVMILKGAGYCVDTAADAEAAWLALKGGDYDLLVTDYIMPGASGLALVRQLRAAGFAVPVVMVSGNVEDLDTPSLTRDPGSRIHAFVRKPFTAADLLWAVRSAVTAEATWAGQS